jgi:hypothetical protein
MVVARLLTLRRLRRSGRPVSAFTPWAALHAAKTQSKATLFEAVWRSFRETLRADGVRGLYRGFGLFTFGGLPSQG